MKLPLAANQTVDFTAVNGNKPVSDLTAADIQTASPFGLYKLHVVMTGAAPELLHVREWFADSLGAHDSPA